MNNQLIAACLLAAALAGCSSPPQVDPVGSAIVPTQVGDPFVFNSESQPIDIDVDPGDRLEHAEAIRLALSNSPAIQQAFARVRIAQAESGQVRVLPNPILSLSLRFPESGSSIIDAGLTAELLSLVKRPGMISAADHRLRAVTAELLTVVLDELASVEDQYALLQARNAEFEILQNRKTVVDQLVELARSRQRAGEGSQLDVLTADSESVLLESEIAEKLAQSRTARLGLARQIGQPGSQANWKIDRWVAPDNQPLSETQIISLALQNRPEIAAAVWELLASGDDVRLAKLSPLDAGEAGISAERDGDWSIGPAVSLGIPVFDLGQHQQARAEAQRIEARHQLTQIRREVVLQIRVAMEELRSNQLILSSVREVLLPIQEKRLTQAQSAYRSGLSDISAVWLAEQELQRSKARMIELELRVTQARIRLDRAAGGRGIVSPNQVKATQPALQEMQK